MIDAKELRIGNLVYTHPTVDMSKDKEFTGIGIVNEIIKVDEHFFKTIINVRGKELNDCGNDWFEKNLFPITLNDQILIQFGFEKRIDKQLFGLPKETYWEKSERSNIKQNESEILFVSSFIVIKDEVNYSLVIEDSKSNFGCKFILLNGVHDLQNRYFDSINKELKL